MDKVSFLNYLFYDLEKQRYNFYLQVSEKDGIKTKWKKFLDVFSDPNNPKNKWFIENCNQRQILPDEIVLDLEAREQLNPTLEKLKKFDYKFYVFDTGSRGYHIHIFFKKELTVKEKELIINYFNADIMKASEKTLIALEFSKHWKSGKIKDLIELKGGSLENEN